MSFLSKGLLLADGILTRILDVKYRGELEVFKVTRLGSNTESYCVRRGETFSHGATFKEAVSDLMYKVSDRDTTEFQTWTLSTSASKAKMIEAYRKITGACSEGTRHFVESQQIADKLTVKEVVELTKGRYGWEQFKDFFS